MSQHECEPKASDVQKNATDKSRWAFLVVLMGLLLGVCLAAPAGAQPTTPARASLDAFSLVERWVRAWDVPEQPGVDTETIPLSAAIVTLRLDGRVFGRGRAGSLDPSPGLVREAARRAMVSANAKISQERDAMWDNFIDELSTRVTITLEIAQTLVPVPDSELALPGLGYSPGVLGIAVRKGEALAVEGPESMLMRGADLAQSAMALANGLTDDASAVLRPPEELAGAGFVFYRFEPVVLAQPAPALGAAFLDRGGRVVGEGELSQSALRALERDIAGHLMGRVWPGVERYGFAGTLDPVTGKAATPFASPFEQAISAFALLRYGSSGETAQRRAGFAAGREALGDLSAVETGETAPWDDRLGACMSLVALSEIQLVDILGDKELNTLRIRCLALLDTLYSDATGFAPDLPDSAHGLVVFALVRAERLDPKDRTDLARGALDRVYDKTPVSTLVAQTPFLGWAQLGLGGGGAEIPHAEALLQMRDLVWEHQLKRDDLGWMDRDLAGGIVFTSAAAPLPSWQTLKPLALLGTMLGDPRLTPGSLSGGELPEQLSNQFSSIRFLRQLCAADQSLHFYAAARGALWGVRMALWDQRLPVETDAMALLSLTETLDSFDRISAR